MFFPFLVVASDLKDKNIVFGFLSINGWESKESGFGCHGKQLAFGDRVNPIMFTLVDKDEGDLPPMLIDFPSYLATRPRPTLIATKLANIARIATNNAVCPIVPVYAADAGGDNPHLMASRLIPHPALSVSAAFESEELDDIDFIPCPFHVISNFLTRMKIEVFLIGDVELKLKDLEAGAEFFAIDLPSQQAWKKLIKQLYKLNQAHVNFLKLESIEMDNLVRLRNAILPITIADTINIINFKRFATRLIDLFIAIKDFIVLLHTPMNDEVAAQFLLVKIVFDGSVDFLTTSLRSMTTLSSSITKYIRLYDNFNKAPFRARCFSTLPHYSWKWFNQAALGITKAPTFQQNLDFLAIMTRGIASRQLFCQYGSSTCALLPRLQCFEPEEAETTVLVPPLTFLRAAMTLTRHGFGNFSAERIASILYAMMKAKEYANIKEENQARPIVSHPMIAKFSQLICSIADFLSPDFNFV